MEDHTDAGFCWAFCVLERVLLLKFSKIREWRSASCTIALLCCVVPVSAFSQTSDATTDATRSASPKTKVMTPGAKKPVAKKPTSSSSNKAHTTGRKTTAATHAGSGTAAARGSKSKYAGSRKGTKKTTARGQQKIDPERAQAIQEALIREHYLSDDAAGTWNQASEEAMRRYQADHGWQAKTVPDSRALISLGLGPSHDHLLNPESAMTTGPFPTHGEASTPASHNAGSVSSSGANPAASDPAAAPAPTTTPAHDAPNPQ
jgi:hypothetical protein